MKHSAPSSSNNSPRQQWFEQVVTQYQARLVRYTVGVVRDVERARDIVQDAYIKLWQQDDPKVDDHVLPWLYTVCRNRAIDIQRKESKMHGLSALDAQRIQDPAPGPEAALASQQAAATLPDLVAQLSTDQQEVLRLKFTEELSYKEIAKITGHSVNNVGLLLHKAIKKLRAEYPSHEVSTRGGAI